MIKSFNCKETEKIFNRFGSRKFSNKIQKIALRKLMIIDAATTLNDLRVPPGNRLEKLSGDKKNQYSIRINDQLRICFTWGNGHASNVYIVDYHN